MNKSQTILARHLALYKKGAVTSNEVVNSLVYRLIENDEVQTVAACIDSLPSEVLDSFEEFLVRMRRLDYRWRPFMIGPGLLEYEERYGNALKQMDAILGFPRR